MVIGIRSKAAADPLDSLELGAGRREDHHISEILDVNAFRQFVAGDQAFQLAFAESLEDAVGGPLEVMMKIGVVAMHSIENFLAVPFFLYEDDASFEKIRTLRDE